MALLLVSEPCSRACLTLLHARARNHFNVVKLLGHINGNDCVVGRRLAVQARMFPRCHHPLDTVIFDAAANEACAHFSIHASLL